MSDLAPRPVEASSEQVGGASPRTWTLALPEDASAHGHRIDALLGWSHRFEAGLALVAFGWMAVAVWRFRKAPRATVAHGGTRRSRAWVLGLALGAFLVVDGTLLVGSEGYLRDVLWNLDVPARDPRTARIEINAHQWSWEARYAGADGRFGTADDVVTWNDLRVPVGVPVWVQLVSTDVVHGFSLPHFRVKLDAIPGRVNQTWFQAAREGEWEVACYQHCGTSHYRMRGVLRALSPDAHAAWLREAGRQAERVYDADDSAANWGWEWKAP
ncbi:cytochrome C oxidase subunit II [Myxococcus stipitatus]|uniref:cytochrome c oxidase subunit II n=1 Tax=Myxococcus stipitatus TaxID=83455 RepID=UPI001F3D36C6|nr:cytochrome C oxidase subunit II [Myxococcus stipitatus]MCE9668320.1 cytochrome C oxidase subunit II [Myxococcus stipitatus]